MIITNNNALISAKCKVGIYQAKKAARIPPKETDV